MNYFSLFDLPVSFDINHEVLHQKYQILQRMTHPDRYASASEQEKRLYMQKNTQINDAYHVLSNVVSRGEHILDLRGTERPGEQETIGDTEFLMQQMELREALASVQTEVDYEVLNRTIAESVADYQDRISILLNEDTPENNTQAAIELSKLKFVIKLANESKQRQRQYDLSQG